MIPSGGILRMRSSKFSLTHGVSTAPSTTTWATCIPWGPSSLAILCANDLRPLFATENAEKLGAPRMDAVAPVNIIVPLPRGTIAVAAARPVKNPEKQAISQHLKNFLAGF
uniref:Uncharacterized protein n=1 Tax=Leptocylindrus danicus TaxID=163516 RepID=A0A7S2LJX5_9STRA